MTGRDPDSDTPGAGQAERYRRLGELDRGGRGVIHGAHDPVLGRRVALKSLRPELESDERAVGELTREAQVTAQLDHPNIAPVYDARLGEQQPFVVMKWIAGRSLAEVLRGLPEEGRGPEQLRALVQLLLRVCDALAFAHDRGVLHCDLKPENLMVGDHGQVFVMDWGMALVKAAAAKSPPEGAANEGAIRLDGSSPAAALGSADSFGEARGTPAYMAPEQLYGLTEAIDERTDVFGLGGLLCEILIGEPPNGQRTLLGAGSSAGTWQAPARSRLWPQLPPELCRIAARALAPRPEDRYPSVTALRADLEQFLEGGGWFETRAYPAGHAIVSEGEPGDAAFAIVSGACDVFRTIDGERTFVRRLEAGDVFGELAVFGGGLRTASVVAAGEVTVKRITGAALNRELDRNPWLAAFVRSLARLLREAEEPGRRGSPPG